MSKTNFEFLDALGQIARDKGISVETLLDALANALVAAYKRRPDAAEEAVVTIDPRLGRDPGLRAGAGRGRRSHPRVGRHP
jgi:N utilization substance protein A